ncbi:hypothetical protein [Cupriavidus necator]|uniref:hypothetical protein n=1 Tax=Cupriavidus necator TaxID=106590 RepID=UPI00129EAC38|nr:hypothetical protein [Cupriavidus necator]
MELIQYAPQTREVWQEAVREQAIAYRPSANMPAHFVFSYRGVRTPNHQQATQPICSSPKPGAGISPSRNAAIWMRFSLAALRSRLRMAAGFCRKQNRKCRRTKTNADQCCEGPVQERCILDP